MAEPQSYAPCRTGIHVCGIDRDEQEFTTELNMLTARPALARQLFDRARAECAAEKDAPFDLVVDLMIGGDIEADFPMTRQMLARLVLLAKETA